jgi:type I restriction enzyme S subunit
MRKTDRPHRLENTMSKTWPKVRLGEVLKRVERYESRNELIEYPFAGTYSFARGIFVGERKMGTTFSLPKIQRIREGDFVYCKIMAWEGAFGLVPNEANNCVMSSAFVVYKLELDKIDPRFLDYYFKVPSHWKSIGNQSTGTNIRRRSLHPMQFEKAEIPLPPLAEQRRIVARIEEVVAQIQEARILQDQVVAEIEALVISVHIQLSGKRLKNIGRFLRLDEDKVAISPTDEYPQVGVRSFAGGLFPKASTSGTETTYKTYNRLYDGALVLSQVKGWEGAVAVCSSELAGWFVSPEYRTFRCIPSEASSDYLATLVHTEWFWGRLKNATRGVGARRERTRPEQFMTIEIPMPDVEQQKIGVHLFAELCKLAPLQAQTATELDALLPAVLDRAFRGELL